MKNLLCDLKDLTNEASVEALFVDRLLGHLHFPDDKIRRKQSIEELEIPCGSRRERYRPDYVLLGPAK